MNENSERLRRTGFEVVVRVARKTGLLVVLGCIASFVVPFAAKAGYAWWLLPSSIAFGGILGILNFRWLALAVERIYMRKGATPVGANIAGAIFTVIKLSIIFVVLFVVIKWQLLDVFALLIGLSLCFMAIIWEGVTIMGRTRENAAVGSESEGPGPN